MAVDLSGEWSGRLDLLIIQFIWYCFDCLLCDL